MNTQIIISKPTHLTTLECAHAGDEQWFCSACLAYHCKTRSLIVIRTDHVGDSSLNSIGRLRQWIWQENRALGFGNGNRVTGWRCESQSTYFSANRFAGLPRRRQRGSAVCLCLEGSPPIEIGPADATSTPRNVKPSHVFDTQAKQKNASDDGSLTMPCSVSFPIRLSLTARVGAGCESST